MPILECLLRLSWLDWCAELLHRDAIPVLLHAPRKGAGIELHAWPGASVMAVHDFLEIGFSG
ncbi:MAG: hypothetical protein VYA08_10530 [Pseudomonadota bacterium]|nr:hypothetical protein [Pseudomonadota bacterium]